MTLCDGTPSTSRSRAPATRSCSSRPLSNMAAVALAPNPLVTSPEPDAGRRVVRRSSRHAKSGGDSINLYIRNSATGTTYLRGKLLGKGGFARCYELIDLSTNKVFAGKIIPKTRVAKPHQRDKIQREIDLHQHLKHANIVEMVTSFEDGDNIYFILELCKQKSLMELLKVRRTITEPEARHYLHGMSLGMRSLHAALIVHRDLKLGNMLIGDDNACKVADFGLATRLNAPSDKKLTVCGTPNYIAPEVLQKRGYNFKVDVWASGCVLYAMLVGKPPFETATLKETYSRITSCTYHMPTHISRAARHLIDWCLQPDPAARPTAEQMLNHEFLRPCGPSPPNTELVVTKPRPKSYAFPDASEDRHKQGVLQSGVRGMEAYVLPLQHTQQHATQHVQQHATPHAPHTATTHVYSSRQQTPSEVKSKRKSRDFADSGVQQDVTPSPSSEPGDTFHGSSRPPSRRSSAPGSASGVSGLGTSVTSEGDNQSQRSTSGSDLGKGNEELNNVAMMCQLLDVCLTHMRTATTNPESVSGENVPWVTKWVDYSNKYGFGFQLSNKSVSVLFNDDTRLCLNSESRCFCYSDKHGQTLVFPASEVPRHLSHKVQLLMYFGSYMSEHLIQGGDSSQPPANESDMKASQFVHMTRWLRTDKAIVMLLSNGTVQVNFFEDHTKIVVSRLQDQYIVTYINQDRKAAHYRLLDLQRLGCSVEVSSRLQAVKELLQSVTVEQ